MLNAYNRIARFYDLLAKIVYGNAIIKAQTHFIDKIPVNSRILIIGGGSGKILKHFQKPNFNYTIDYVEASSEMLRLTKKKTNDTQCINFIHGTQEILTQQYDVIITAFFLDLFQRDELHNVILKLKKHHRKNGLWIISDFYPSKNILHKTLYFFTKTFFKITTKLEVNELYKFEQFVLDNNYVTTQSKTWYSGFIRSYLIMNKETFN